VSVILNPRGFTLQDAELAKFTNLGQVGITGHAVPKTEVTYDSNNNPVQIDMFSGASHRTNVQIPDATASLAVLGGAWWAFEAVGASPKFYLWYFINGAGTDPALAGRTGIQVTSTSDPQAISDATVDAINSSSAVDHVRAFGFDKYNISVLHTKNGKVEAPTAGSNLIKLSTITTGIDFRLASRTTVNYDVNNNPITITRVEF
jgi:hypothetical protein